MNIPWLNEDGEVVAQSRDTQYSPWRWELCKIPTTTTNWRHLPGPDIPPKLDHIHMSTQFPILASSPKKAVATPPPKCAKGSKGTGHHTIQTEGGKYIISIMPNSNVK